MRNRLLLTKRGVVGARLLRPAADFLATALLAGQSGALCSTVPARHGEGERGAEQREEPAARVHARVEALRQEVGVKIGHQFLSEWRT